MCSSHPSHKNKNVARVGHPIFSVYGARNRQYSGSGSIGQTAALSLNGPMPINDAVDSLPEFVSVPRLRKRRWLRISLWMVGCLLVLLLLGAGCGLLWLRDA